MKWRIMAYETRHPAPIKNQYKQVIRLWTEVLSHSKTYTVEEMGTLMVVILSFIGILTTLALTDVSIKWEE